MRGPKIPEETATGTGRATGPKRIPWVRAVPQKKRPNARSPNGFPEEAAARTGSATCSEKSKLRGHALRREKYKNNSLEYVCEAIFVLRPKRPAQQRNHSDCPRSYQSCLREPAQSLACHCALTLELMAPPPCSLCGSLQNAALSDSLRRKWASEEGVKWRWRDGLAYWKLCQPCHRELWPEVPEKAQQPKPNAASHPRGPDSQRPQTDKHVAQTTQTQTPRRPKPKPNRPSHPTRPPKTTNTQAAKPTRPPKTTNPERRNGQEQPEAA